MPMYTYECENCGERFEAKQSFNDSPLTVCPTCEGKLYRVIQPAGIVFKGSGFYVTDSKAKQNLATTKTSKDEAKSTSSEPAKASSTESAPTTTPAKSEAKSE